MYSMCCSVHRCSSGGSCAAVSIVTPCRLMRGRAHLQVFRVRGADNDLHLEGALNEYAML